MHLFIKTYNPILCVENLMNWKTTENEYRVKKIEVMTYDQWCNFHYSLKVNCEGNLSSNAQEYLKQLSVFHCTVAGERYQFCVTLSISPVSR